MENFLYAYSNQLEYDKVFSTGLFLLNQDGYIHGSLTHYLQDKYAITFTQAGTYKVHFMVSVQEPGYVTADIPDEIDEFGARRWIVGAANQHIQGFFLHNFQAGQKVSLKNNDNILTLNDPINVSIIVEKMAVDYAVTP